MFRAFKSILSFRFSRYTQSIQNYTSAATITKTQLKVNHNVTFYGIPILTTEVANKLVQTVSQASSATTIFLTDCSQNLAINSKIAEDIFKEKFYDKIVDGKQMTLNDTSNFELPNHVKECFVIPGQFFETIWKQPDNEEEELNFDDQTFTKMKDKLRGEYGVDLFISIPAALTLFKNPESLCLAGMSEIRIRRCLADTYPLELIKQAFLNMAENMRELKTMTQQKFNQQSANKALLVELKETFPDVMIGKQAEQLFYLLHQLDQDCIVFADTMILDRLQQLIQASTPEISQQIRQEKSLRKLLSYAAPTDQDEVQLEKHAILQIIFQTELWSQPHISNSFPYLKTNYLNLQPQQKQTIRERYLYHLNRYKSAWNRLIE